MAGVIGGPLSGWILEGFHDALGLRGWQWMFLIEGLPVVLLGVVVWCSLPESFERVTWLSDEQKHLLREELAGESSARPSPPSPASSAIRRCGCWWRSISR